MDDRAGLAGMGRHTHVLLTSFRRDGTAVGTPVWVVADGDALLAITGAGTGKVARLRHTRRVRITPCRPSGRPLPGHHPLEATADLLTAASEVRRVRSLIRARYGLRYTFATALLRLRHGGPGAEVAIRITARPTPPMA